MRKVINISLPERLYEEVERAVKLGRYGTKSELFREILRAWKEGKIQGFQGRFNAGLLLRNIKEHAGRGGPRNLSAQHDRYLYGK